MYITYFNDGEYAKPYVMRIGVIGLDELYLHEETVDSHLRWLKRSMKEDGILSNPVIVDENTGVVLDGTHRVQCLRELGYKYVLAAFVDYRDPRIRIKNWYRVLRGDVKNIIEYARRLGFREQASPDVRSYINGRAIVICVGGKLYVYDTTDDVYHQYIKLRELERTLLTVGFSIDFVHEDVALDECLGGGTVILTPKIAKEDVVRNALSGRLFPPKTTRHIFPIRPLTIDLPLRYLRMGHIGRERMNAMITQFLMTRQRIKVLGRTFLDRFYEEDSLVFYV